MSKTSTKKITKKRLVLLDAHAIIHRAYHALPDFASSDGTPTGALYGVSTMLLRIITDLKPDYLIACFDLPEKTFRHEVYEGYKGTRKKSDDALISQIDKSREIFSAFGVPIYAVPGFEADDLLGTFVELTKKEKDLEVVIASGDMDTLQLVEGDRVSVYTLKKGLTDTVLYTEKSVTERFGFPPTLIPDYKGLRGDPSDNIIGIAGIGEKTATTLITTFGTIEQIYKALKKDESKFKEVKITDRIIGLLKDGEEEALFSKTLATIRRDAPIELSIADAEWKNHIKRESTEATLMKYEFKSLLNRVKNIFGEHTDNYDNKIEDKPEEVVDQKVFREAQILAGLIVADGTLPDLSGIYRMTNTEKLEDAVVVLKKDIENHELSYVANHIEIPLIPIVKQMEDNGILIDVEYLEKLQKQYHAEVDILTDQIYEEVGHEFNINSPKQLGEVLFDELKLGEGTKLKKSEGGARTTRESELVKYKDAHPIIPLILQYREYTKLLSTYIDTLPTLVDGENRIHALWNQLGAATGRFSSERPNLQNIPTKTELGKNIRRAFVAKNGFKLVSFDYSQIELRIAAILSGDEYLAKVFQEQRDVHAAVSSRVFGVPENEVTADMRRQAKVINFGILYGMGVNALKENLGTDRKTAEIFYDNYFKEFPSIRGYLDGVKDFAKRLGYTTTLFGRRRYFPMLRSPLPFIRATGERMAINAPIQGTNADIMKLGMIKINKFLEENNLSSEVKIVLQVHDELVYEISENILDEIIPKIENILIDIIPIEFLENRVKVPLRVGVAFSSDWGSMK